MKLSDFIGEATEYDKKEMLEERKPKSWLKSVSAFANGIGGALFFGVSNDEILVGLDDAKGVSEKISEAIKTKMDPAPQVILEIHAEGGKEFVVLRVPSGQETPYYYTGDGNRIAYVRIGNESVPASAVDLKRLVLRGSNTSFDSLSTRYLFESLAFTKLRSVYRMRTGTELTDSDFVSFELVDENNMLTNAGVLLADESPMRHSRLFCTRWYGLNKASGIDDRMEVYSPGGMFDGSIVQELDTDNVASKRRNPVIADIFSRMHFMERRGSGFKKIKADYHRAVNYRPEVEPMFRSTPTSFFATLYNLNYNVPIEKVLIDSKKIAVAGEKVLIASENLLIEAAIDSLHANKNTKEKAKKLFAHMSFDDVFGRNDIMNIVNISVTAAGNLINKLKKAGVVEPVIGQGKGKYKFTEPKK